MSEELMMLIDALIYIFMFVFALNILIYTKKRLHNDQLILKKLDKIYKSIKNDSENK
ncbi:hypothetical protein [Caldalkalibacillus mannanilyticus]|uniref:hypothetical protein n=1 Tax=Caldalkalibacillus mannanilyticus TaxID=1418 RepID=UPI000ABA2C5E|nr:hypothetical protein [Caldalkalibacillus mannanilyticus]